MGTPKTLQEAITNGGDDAAAIEQHVRDFIAQKFTIAMGDDKVTLMQLWKMLIENKE